MRPLSFFRKLGLACLLSTTVLALPLSAQDDDFAYLNQAITAIMNEAQLKVSSDYGFFDGFCVWGAFLDKSETVRWAQDLSSSSTYIFIAGGDEDATDVDLLIEDENGVKVLEDKTSSRSAFLKFTPSKSQKYTITLKLYGCKSSGSFCAMTLMQRYSNSLRVSDLQNASVKLGVLYALVESYVDVRFHDADNQWCLYGLLLSPGSDLAVTNVSLGAGQRYLIAAGDSHTDDINVCLLNNSHSEELKCDEEDWEDNPVGMIDYYSTGTQSYWLKLKNARTASSKSLILSSVLVK